MTAKKIYESALAILGETRENEAELDYRERAPYLIATFCCNAASVDRDFRESHRLGAQGKFSEIYVSLDDPFPLCKRFTDSAAFYLASMLISDTDEDFSERLFEKYCDSLSRAVSEIPFSKGKTKNAYGQ